MMKSMCLALALLLIPLPAQAKNIVIDTAENHVDITTGFSGENITVFGTIDRDGDVAVVLKGPLNRVVMRKKEPVGGMWLNRESVDFKRVPLFYSYALSRPEGSIAERPVLDRYMIGLDALQFDAANYDDRAHVEEFQEALIRTQQAKGLYKYESTPVRFISDRLFRATFYLPSDVPVGHYRVEAYLLKDKEIVDSATTGIDVAQAGASAEILNFAVDYSFAYALLGLLMAAGAGFLAFWMSRTERA